VRNDIPKALQSKEYELDKTQLSLRTGENNQLFSDLEKEAQEKGYALQRTVSGLVMVPRRMGAI